MAIQFRLNRISIRLLVSYGVILVLPCVFIVLMYYQSLSLATRDCIDESLIFLRQIRSGMDGRLDVMDRASFQLVSDIAVKTIMYYDQPAPGCPYIYQIREFSNKLYHDKLGILSDELNFYRLVFRDNELIFYDNAVSIGLEFYFKNFMNYSGIEFAEWYSRVFNLTQRTILPADTIRAGVDTTQAMTYIYPLSKAPGWRSEGLILFMIPTRFIDDIMSLANISGDGAVCIIDPKGTVLYSAGFYRIIDPGRIDQAEGYYRDGQDMVIYTKSPQSGLIFAASLPYSGIMSRVINIKRTAQLLVILMVLAELVICVSFMRFNAGPVVDFVRNLSTLLTGTETKSRNINEYDFLKKSIPQLKNLNAAVKEKQRLLQKYFLTQLLEGNFKNSAHILSLAAESGFNLEAAAYCAVSFENCEEPTKAKALLEKHKIGAGASALLYYQLEPRTIFALYGFAKMPDESELRQFFQALEEELRFLKDELGYTGSAGAGRIYADAVNICFSYNQSRYCAALAARQPSENQGVLEYDKVPLSMGSFYYPISLEQKLMNAARHRELAQIEDAFEELKRENLEKRSLSGPMGTKLTDNLTATLLKIYGDVVFDHSAIEDVLIRIGKHTALGDILNALREEFLLVGGRARETRLSTRHELLLDGILDVVHKKYTDPSLSICYMANQFHLSESYFSQLFKDLTGEHFSTYLERIRLSRAQELLRDSELEIEEIAHQVGYFNSTSFRRAFKRMAGISPSAFQINHV